MAIMKFPENDNYTDPRYVNGIQMEALYNDRLNDYVFRYKAPDNPEKYLIATRQLPTCIEFVLSKKTRGYHIPESKRAANKKTVIVCAMTWGLSKLRSVPEFK